MSSKQAAGVQKTLLRPAFIFDKDSTLNMCNQCKRKNTTTKNITQEQTGVNSSDEKGCADCFQHTA